MEIFLDKRAVKQIRVSAQDAIDEGDTETLREDILDSFTEEQDLRAELHVALITFGGDRAELRVPLTRAQDVRFDELTAVGRTPMGGAGLLAGTASLKRSVTIIYRGVSRTVKGWASSSSRVLAL